MGDGDSGTGLTTNVPAATVSENNSATTATSPPSAARIQEIFQNAERLLTPRENQVFKSLASGMSNKEIAFEMTLASNTIAVYRRNINDKLGKRWLKELKNKKPKDKKPPAPPVAAASNYDLNLSAGRAAEPSPQIGTVALISPKQKRLIEHYIRKGFSIPGIAEEAGLSRNVTQSYVSALAARMGFGDKKDPLPYMREKLRDHLRDKMRRPDQVVQPVSAPASAALH